MADSHKYMIWFSSFMMYNTSGTALQQVGKLLNSAEMLVLLVATATQHWLHYAKSCAFPAVRHIKVY